MSKKLFCTLHPSCPGFRSTPRKPVLQRSTVPRPVYKLISPCLRPRRMTCQLLGFLPLRPCLVCKVWSRDSPLRTSVLRMLHLVLARSLALPLPAHWIVQAQAKSLILVGSPRTAAALLLLRRRLLRSAAVMPNRKAQNLLVRMKSRQLFPLVRSFLRGKAGKSRRLLLAL